MESQSILYALRLRLEHELGRDDHGRGPPCGRSRSSGTGGSWPGSAPLRPRPRWSRRLEERVIELCARGDYRPSRWLRAGDPRMLAGVAVMLASQESFDRTRMLALA